MLTNDARVLFIMISFPLTLFGLKVVFSFDLCDCSFWISSGEKGTLPVSRPLPLSSLRVREKKKEHRKKKLSKTQKSKDHLNAIKEIYATLLVEETRNYLIFNEMDKNYVQ